MNSKSVLLAALLAGALPMAAVAQSTAPELPPSPSEAPAVAAPAQKAPPAPSAFPAKIALVAFEQAVIATNEGQHALQDVQKKYQPKQEQLEKLNTEIDSLKKQLQSAPPTMTDEARATLTKKIDADQKELDRGTDDARTAYQSDLQDAYGKVAQKVHEVMLKYVTENGYTLLLNVGDQQSPVIWAAQDKNADITEAVVDAYNKATPNVSAPTPEGPAAARKPASTAPHSTTPHSTATQHAAPKP